MINKILADIEELKNQVDNMQITLIDIVGRLGELEFKAGINLGEEYLEEDQIKEALENPPEDNIEEEDTENDE